MSELVLPHGHPSLHDSLEKKVEVQLHGAATGDAAKK